MNRENKEIVKDMKFRIEYNYRRIKEVQEELERKEIDEERARIMIEACHDSIRFFQHRLLRHNNFYK